MNNNETPEDRLTRAEFALIDIKENANGCCICDELWEIADKFFCPGDYEEDK